VYDRHRLADPLNKNNLFCFFFFFFFVSFQNGPSNIRCCLSKTSAPTCTNGSGQKGACVIRSTCGSGTLHPGFCQGYPADVVCCVGGRHGEGMAPPASLPGGVTTGGPGWLTRAGQWTVERIDSASRLRFFSGHSSPVNKFLLHTIEGTGGNGDWEGGRATLDSKSFWPHFIVAKDRAGTLRIGQFISMAVQGRAARNPGNAGTIQVEIGGKAADPFTSKAWLAEPVRALFQAVRQVYPSIPNSAPRAFEGSNRAYGSSAPSRISASAWASTAGLVGHQHAPSNDHWDPGAINPAVLLVVNAGDPNPGATVDPVQPVGGNDPEPSDDHDAEDDNAPPCVANRVAGRCLPTSRCTGGKKASRNSPPNVSGCGHIADPNVQCCADEPRADGGNLGGASCTAYGVAGSCEATANCARVGRQSFPSAAGQVTGCESIPSRDIQCCADTMGPALPVSNSCPEYAGLVFPLVPDSLAEISVNWGFPRSNGRRCHAAVDIYTKGAKQVVAVSDGEVTAIMKNWYSCSGGTIDAIFVYHSSGPLQGKTINYGEVNPGTYNVRVGSTVTKGERIGIASRCAMLHFELYQGRRTRNSYWLPSGSIGSGCARTSMRTKPAELLDPRDLLRCTMPPGARFRNGVSFLEDPTDLSAFDEDGNADGDDGFVEGVESESSLGGGEIAGIAIGLLLFCCLVAGLAYWIITVRTRDRGQAYAQTNSITMQTDDSFKEAANNLARAAYTQQYTCAQCNNSYASADDLVQHRQLRH
jgi:hypothetical protein